MCSLGFLAWAAGFSCHRTFGAPGHFRLKLRCPGLFGPADIALRRQAWIYVYYVGFHEVKYLCNIVVSVSYWGFTIGL